ncbi:hypothetical protein H5410_023608 [Solanum commersonii]|uniref:Uncharacterized protein n=1 Tax=Solanum commersonii TaxID=4109 RepID=A0A9J5ZJ92_SOLCO|nr:hypothetical protein H5410_023608 [Solanum commersonii]
MEELGKIGKILGFSILEGRNNTVRKSTNEGQKQVCVYRYYPHSDLVQLIPPSATTETRVVFTQLPDRKAPTVAF